MTFPNAARGIKKLFIGELLALIGAVLSALSVIFAKPVVSGDDIVDIGATGARLGIVGTLLGIAGIVLIVAFILQLIGIANAAKDEEAFKAALYTILFGIIVSIVGAILTYLFPNSTIISNIGTIASNLIEILTTFLVIGGIGVLGQKIGDQGLQEKAGKLLGVILTVIVLRFIANFVIVFFKENFAEVIVTVVGIMILLLSIIQYALYLSLLSKAKNSLESK